LAIYETSSSLSQWGYIAYETLGLRGGAPVQITMEEKW
jgi:hypothetical protein